MITEAILALETEVQRNPTNSAAWQALGQAHAENDKDNLAILSLEKAVEVDPQNLDALAALAVSYTNDFARDKALEALETWLRRNKVILFKFPFAILLKVREVGLSYECLVLLYWAVKFRPNPA